MKKYMLLLLVLPCILHAQIPDSLSAPELNSYTFSERITQSTMHDAIQLYYAKQGLTFYFKRVKLAGSGSNDFEVIDIYNGKNLGSIGNFAEDLQVNANEMGSFNNAELIKKFIRKYNGKFTYVMTKLTPSGTDETEKMCRTIIERILRRNANISSDASLADAYQDNEYLKSETEPVITIMVDTARARSFLAEAIKSTRTAVEDLGGGSGIAGNVARGAARFLIERANQEINAAFFRRLKDVMEKTEELQKLFPETYQLTSSLETYNFDVAINALRTKLTSDLENILGNLPMLATIKKYQEKLNKVPELTYLFVACDLMNELRLERAPGQIIHKVYASSYVRRPVSNEANVFKLAGFLSFSLRDVMLCDAAPENKGWISPLELDYSPEVLKIIFEYYLGLLQQSDPGIVFSFDTSAYSFNQCIRDMKSKVERVAGFLSETYESIIIMNKEIDDIRRLTGFETSPELIDVNKFEHYTKISMELLGLVERTVMFPELIPSAEQAKILKIISELRLLYLPATQKVVLLASNVEKKQYNEAIYNVGELLDMIVKKFGNEDVDRNNAMLSNLFKYGQFFASVATAEDGDDVKAAIDAVALPTGSSSLKKDLALNLAVNGYIGYFSRRIEEGDVFVDGFTQSYGITAPIGFTLSTGFRKAGSVSLFAGVLDVGAIAQYELKEDQNTGTTQVEPTIEWGNIFSPSAMLVYGFPFYLPLSAGIGYQWLANSAEISNDTYSLTARFNFFLCFDIPFVNIASRKRTNRPSFK